MGDFFDFGWLPRDPDGSINWMPDSWTEAVENILAPVDAVVDVSSELVKDGVEGVGDALAGGIGKLMIPLGIAGAVALYVVSK